MKTGQLFNGWTLAIIIPVLVIIIGGAAIIAKSHDDPGMEITLSPPKEIRGSIYVGGAVNDPGIYPFYPDDSLDDIIGAAGGIKDGFALSDIKLTFAPAEGGQTAQRININRAEKWLLEALPGIGETRANAILEYRGLHGSFRDTRELLSVPGFGETVFQQVKDLVTVND